MASIPDLKRDFERLIQRNRLGHAYLFFGESPGTAAGFASSLASYIELGKWDNPRATLVDAAFFEGASGGIDGARNMISFLWRLPATSPRRTAVVFGADLMTVQAEQAILKLVEEPPRHGLILATARDPGALILPLASRFQKIYVNIGEEARPASEEARRYASVLLKAPAPKELSETLKALIAEEKDALVGEVVSVLISELRKHPMENWRTIKELLDRWVLINQYNVNKRLQIEAALVGVIANNAN